MTNEQTAAPEIRIVQAFEAAKAAKLLKYEMKPGREELHQLFLAGKTRKEARALGWDLNA